MNTKSNIILDTNAFIYLTNIERNIENALYIEKKPVNEKVFYDYCINSNHLFVTGQTLYELFWQSVEKTNDIYEFAVLFDAIAKYRRIYNVKFSYNLNWKGNRNEKNNIYIGFNFNYLYFYRLWK